MIYSKKSTEFLNDLAGKINHTLVANSREASQRADRMSNGIEELAEAIQKQTELQAELMPPTEFLNDLAMKINYSSRESANEIIVSVDAMAARIEVLAEAIQKQTELQAELMSTLAKYFSLEIARSLEDEAKRKEIKPPTEYDLKF